MPLTCAERQLLQGKHVRQLISDGIDFAEAPVNSRWRPLDQARGCYKERMHAMLHCMCDGFDPSRNSGDKDSRLTQVSSLKALSMAKLRSIVFLFFSCFCMHSLSSSHAQTHNATLKQGQQLSDQDGDYLVSENGLFKLGFFSPGNSSIFGATSNRYLGVWYYKLPNDPDAVWVANPETPIIDTSGVFALASDATLKLIHGGGQVSVSDPNKTVSGNVTLSLLDTGNLVLREVLATNGTAGNVIWESFDHPTNTLLPGMKLGMNVKAGQNRTISSWFSDQIPAPGAFRLGIDPGSTNQLIIWRRDEVYWSSGVWENGSFQNAPD